MWFVNQGTFFITCLITCHPWQNIFENDEVIWMFQIARLKNHPDTYTAEGRAADKLFSPFSKQYPYHYYQNSRTD